MNTVELRTSQQPEPQPQPGDVYRHPVTGALYILHVLFGIHVAVNLEDGSSCNGFRPTLSNAVSGLTYIGPCRITVEQLKGEGKL